MDFNGLLVLGLIWLLFNLFGMGRKGERPKPRTAPPRSGPGPARGGRSGGDPTQREGSRLEQLLRELERSLEQAGGAQPAPPASRMPAPASRLPGPSSQSPASSWPSAEDEDVEERESLEEPEQVVSLESDVRRPQRARVDQDDAAEELVRRRIEVARSRDRALTKADHQTFDARIRQEPADHTAVRRYTPAQLRDAIVWREILGPPVSERREP